MPMPERSAEQVIQTVYRRLLSLKQTAAGKPNRAQLDLPGLLAEELRSTPESRASSKRRKKP